MSGDRHSKQRGQRWEALLQAREVCIRQLLITRVMGARTGKPASLLPPALVKKNNPSECVYRTAEAESGFSDVCHGTGQEAVAGGGVGGLPYVCLWSTAQDPHFHSGTPIPGHGCRPP